MCFSKLLFESWASTLCFVSFLILYYYYFFCLSFSSSLYFVFLPLQATWFTVLHTMTSSTIDGRPEPPVGRTCLWRISNPTLGNTDQLVCAYITCMCIQTTHTHTYMFPGFSVISHMGIVENWNLFLQTKICVVARSFTLTRPWRLRSRCCLGRRCLAVALQCLFLLGYVYTIILSSHIKYNIHLVCKFVSRHRHTGSVCRCCAVFM